MKSRNPRSSRSLVADNATHWLAAAAANSQSPEAQIQNLKPLTTEDIQLINNEDKRVEEEEGFSVVN